MAALAEGVVVERYKVAGKLGAGAMGEVWLAEDVGLGRKVALKILAEGHRDNPEVRARFVREARAVAAISHPNVVQVFTTGEWDGRPYLAMELLPGKDLQGVVRAEGPMDARRAAHVIADAAKGLAAAARAGLIHRDVKPSNIMLLPDGAVKVTDFGLAKPVAPGDDPGLTALGVVVGTPDYIAPEQARGDAIDHRVDIYALGCTLFFLLTGRPPYRKSLDDDEKYMKVVTRHLRDPVPDPRLERPSTDDELAEIQMVMMAKDADQRYSYEQVQARLERVVARLTGLVPESQEKKATRPMESSGSGAAARGAGAGRPGEMSAVAEPRPSAETTAERPRKTTAGPAEITHGSMKALGDAEPSLGSLGASVPGGRPKLAGWLVALTALSGLVFLVGLGLLVFGPLPARPAAAEPPADAAPPPPPPPPDAAVLVDVAKPPPAGMLLVDQGVDEPFYVDRAPVSNKAWAEFRVKHKYKKADAERPVTGVSWEYAAEYARFRGKRLVKDHEWDAASKTPAFVPAGMKLFEWVDDGAGGAGATGLRPVRGVNGAAAKKKAAGDKTITFRLAQDPG